MNGIYHKNKSYHNSRKNRIFFSSMFLSGKRKAKKPLNYNNFNLNKRCKINN